MKTPIENFVFSYCSVPMFSLKKGTLLLIVFHFPVQFYLTKNYNQKG